MKRTLLLCGLLALVLSSLRAQATVPTVASTITAQSLTVGAPATEFDLTTIFSVPGVTGQVVQFDTTFGRFNVETLATAAPNHVANFLAYVNAGDYSATLFHRAASLESGQPHSILQGGGYTAVTTSGAVSSFAPITKRAPVNLEYNLANSRGTLAAARTSDINSATSEWYFNTRDNTTILGPTNASGYSVFARVLGTGMTVVDTIANFPQYNVGAGFTNTPLRNVTAEQTSLLPANLIFVNSTTVIPVFPSSTGQTAVVSFTVSSNNTNVATATLVAGRTLAITPVGAGSATLTLTATDTNGNTAQTTVPVTVVATTVPDRRDVLTIGTPAALPLAVAGYNTWTTAAALPAWLFLSSSTGTLTGTPPADTAAFSFVLNALDANSAVFGQNVTLLFKASPASADFAFSPADFTEAVTGRTFAGLNFTGNTTFTDPSEPVASPYRTGIWTYFSPATNEGRLILTYPAASPVAREGIDLYHRASLTTDALRYDLDNSDVSSGHQLTSADFRSTFLPRDVAASVVSSRNVSLTWRDEAWTDGYMVYRTTTATPPDENATPISGTSPSPPPGLINYPPFLTSAEFTDVAPPRGSALYYWIVAIRTGQATKHGTSPSATITVPDVPIILRQPTTVLAAVNTSEFFNLTTLGTGLRYQWFFAGKAIKGATSEDLTLRVSKKSAGTYTLRITDNTGDTAEARVTLRVAVVPKFTVKPPKSLALLVGGSGRLSAAASGEAVSYQWFRNGIALEGRTSSTLTFTNAILADAGSYTVRASNIAGSVLSKPITVTVR